MRRTLVVMAYAPILGEVKTRLCPPLGMREAARLHECCMLDVLAKASLVPDVDLVVAYAPADALSFFQDAAPSATAFLPQDGENPDERMSHCFRRLVEPGRSVVVMRSDIPTLPARCLELAFGALSSDGVDVVFGPVSDGGYYLVGVNKPCPGLVESIGWGSAGGSESGIMRAAELGLGWYRLPEWHDLNHPSDLAYLCGELLEQGLTGPSAWHTRKFLQCLVESGVLSRTPRAGWETCPYDRGAVRESTHR